MTSKIREIAFLGGVFVNIITNVIDFSITTTITTFHYWYIYLL